MSDNQSTGKWFFMKNYNPDPTKTKDENDLQALINRLDLQQQAINELDNKLEKLIQSNKSLIAYFSTVNDRDARDLNYRIRSYSSKNNQLPPVNFVPEHHKQP